MRIPTQEYDIEGDPWPPGETVWTGGYGGGKAERAMRWLGRVGDFYNGISLWSVRWRTSPYRMALQQHEFYVPGMDCANESRVIRAALEAVPGVQEIHIDLVRQRLLARAEETQATAASLQRVLAGVGFPAQLVPPTATALTSTDGSSAWRREGLLVMAAGLLLVGGAALEMGLVAGLHVGLSGTAYPGRILLGISLLVSMRSFVHRAWSAVRQGHADMNTLVTVAAVGAIVLGDWVEAALVALLFAVAHQLEAASAARVRRSIDECLSQMPTTAKRVNPESGEVEVIAAGQVKVEDLLVLHPGEQIPADGVVETGCSEVDQAAMTGESLPVSVAAGAVVYAGTVNGRGALRVRVTAAGGESRAERLERTIREAQAQRSATERWVDSFARVYTPLVLGLAVGVAALPPLWGHDWREWFYAALVLLLIACPCALVIATPVAMVSGITALARSGVLVRGGEGMERAARVRSIAFDKTGVLTQGDLAIREMVWPPGMAGQARDQQEMLRRVLAVEALSEHPAARAFVGYAQGVLTENDGPTMTAERFHALPGLGGEGMVEGVWVWVGSPALAAQRGAWTEAAQELADALPVAENSLMTAGSGDQLWLVAALADTPRPEARRAMEDLKQLGIADIVMLSGDHHAHCEAVARRLGIERYQAALLPEQKLEAIRAMERTEGPVAMVGDGLNDAAALAAASFSVAAGSSASHQSMQVAEAIVWDGNLRRIAVLLAQARRTMRVIQHNVWFAIGSKVVFAVFAVLGLATLWMAVLADVGATLVVTANGLRLLRRVQPMEMDTSSEDIAPRTSS